MQNAPKLTLCMIVRDEAVMLPLFLERVDGLWDELVAVDTGSLDETVSILRRAGARVGHFAWVDDFSAARNASLAMATGDWVLVLDADEMVSSELVGEVRALLREPSVGAATITMCNQMPNGQVRQTPLLRLFRRSPSIAYEHRIHEDASASVQVMLAERGLRLVHMQGGVEHLGYVRTRAAERAKRERDGRLLDLALAERPRDLYLHYKRVELARYWGERSRAAHAAREGLMALEAARAGLERLHFLGSFASLVARELMSADPRQAAAWLMPWEPAAAESAEYFYTRGEFFERGGEFARAEHDYARALTAGGARTDQFNTVRPRLGLCRMALARGDVDRAMAESRAVLELAPAEPEALLVGIALARGTGGQAAVDAFVDAHRARVGASNALDLALADEAFARRDGLAARDALLRALGPTPMGADASRLARAHVLAGDVDEARMCAMSAMAAHPEAGLCVLVCNMASARDTDLVLDIDEETAARSMREWVDVLLDSAQSTSIAAFLRMIPTVSSLFPWLERYCVSRLQPGTPTAARLGMST